MPLTLKHWRTGWTLRCAICRELLEPVSLQTAIPAGPELLSRRVLAHAERGAAILERALADDDARLLRRIHRALTFATWLGDYFDPRGSLTSANPGRRMFALCAIARADGQPLRKVAWLLATSDHRRADRINRALNRSDHARRWVRNLSSTMRKHEIGLRRVRAGRSSLAVQTTTQTASGHTRSVSSSIYARAARLAIADLQQLPASRIAMRRLLRAADRRLRQLRSLQSPARLPVVREMFHN